MKKMSNLKFGSTVSCDKILSVKDSLLLQVKKQENHQICVIDFVSHREIIIIVIGRSAIQLVFFFLFSFVFDV